MIIVVFYSVDEWAVADTKVVVDKMVEEDVVRGTVSDHSLLEVYFDVDTDFRDCQNRRAVCIWGKSGSNF